MTRLTATDFETMEIMACWPSIPKAAVPHRRYWACSEFSPFLFCSNSHAISGHLDFESHSLRQNLLLPFYWLRCSRNLRSFGIFLNGYR